MNEDRFNKFINHAKFTAPIGERGREDAVKHEQQVKELCAAGYYVVGVSGNLEQSGYMVPYYTILGVARSPHGAEVIKSRYQPLATYPGESENVTIHPPK